jgi:hypothetical protein
MGTSLLELLAQCLIARSAREDRAFGAAAFLSRLQTKSVSAPPSSRTAARDPGRWNPQLDLISHRVRKGWHAELRGGIEVSVRSGGHR